MAKTSSCRHIPEPVVITDIHRNTEDTMGIMATVGMATGAVKHSAKVLPKLKIKYNHI